MVIFWLVRNKFSLIFLGFGNLSHDNGVTVKMFGPHDRNSGLSLNEVLLARKLLHKVAGPEVQGL